MGALISSKVNQWTLLVGAIPIVYALSLGRPSGIPLDARQTGELLLTSAQSLFAAVLVVNLRFRRSDALWLVLLFAGNFLFTSTEVRLVFAGIYLMLAFGMLAVFPERRREFLRLALSLPPQVSRSASSGGGTASG